MAERLTPLDGSFLRVESESAHMHVAWTAVFDAPRESRRPKALPEAGLLPGAVAAEFDSLLCSPGDVRSVSPARNTG